MNTTSSTGTTPTMNPSPPASRPQWAGLAGRPHGREDGAGRSFVFLHGLTFDSRMWDPVLAALPPDHRSIAFDLPGHGHSPALPQHNLATVVAAIHHAVLDAQLDAPILVGHSIGGPLAALYAAQHPAAAVVSVEAPIRLEPFAQLLRSLRSQLKGDGFAEAWSIFQASFHLELLPDPARALLQAGDRPGDHQLQQLVLGYQSDLLERPLDEVVRWRDDGLRRLGAARTPYLTLHANPLDRSDRAWLNDRLPQAEIVVWPVEHHFPHLAHPARFAALLTGLAAGLPSLRERQPR
jgi:pimeloyl-ACP methyl ester carboxylesterase